MTDDASMPPSGGTGWSVRPDATEPNLNPAPPRFAWSPNPASMPVATQPEVWVQPGEPAARSRRRRLLGATVAFVVTAALVAAPAAIVHYERLSRGTGDVLVDRVVPADSAVYGAAYLDPPLSTKRAVQGFTDHFPSLRNSLGSRVSSLGDSILAGSGLKYDTDVKPWLGTQIAFFIEVGNRHFDGAALIATTNESAALSALDRGTRAGNPTATWSTASYRGVSIAVGALHGCDSCGAPAYAVVDHVAMIGSSKTVIEHGIDVARGATRSLGSDSLYRETATKLDTGRLAEVYLSAAPLVAALQDQLSSADQFTQSLAGRLTDELAAYRSAGISLSVQSDRATLQVVSLTDPSKFPAAARSSQAGLSLLDWLPASSFAVLSGSTAGAGVLAGLGTVGVLSSVGSQTSSSFTQVTNGLAVPNTTTPPQPALTPAPLSTSPRFPSPRTPFPGNDLVQHLTGPAAASIWRATDGSPRGAFVVSSDSASALRTAFSSILSLAATPDVRCDASGCAAGPGAAPHAVPHSGTDITVSANGMLAYATVGQVGVIGNGADAVADVLDAHATGRNILTSGGFPAGVARSSSAGLLWADMQQAVSVIRDQLSPSDRASFDDTTGGNLAPLRVLLLTSTGDRSTQTVTMQLTLGT